MRARCAGMILYRFVRSVLAMPIQTAWRVEVVGLDALPAGPCVLAPNHESLSDTLFVASAIPRPARHLAKAELFRSAFGPLLRALGAIPVRRGVGDEEAIRAAVAAARGGDSVVIHPQGTVIGPSDRPWRRGAARVAIEAGVPLVPIALVNTAQVLRPGESRIGFPRVRVVVGAPIEVGPARTSTPTEAKLFTDRVRAAVEALGAA
jgi:1-acyl-sn-glycerol-3-phosphate acyltransferase